MLPQDATLRVHFKPLRMDRYDKKEETVRDLEIKLKTLEEVKADLQVKINAIKAKIATMDPSFPGGSAGGMGGGLFEGLVGR